MTNKGLGVVVNHSGNATAAPALARKIESGGGQALTVKVDVSERADVVALSDDAEKSFGGVDVLVNNAGIMLLSSADDTEDASFDRQVGVNLKGSFNSMREAAMRLRSRSRIVNFSSSAAGQFQPRYGTYAATKAGVQALSIVLAEKLRGRAVSVSAVAPWPIATGLFLTDKSTDQVDQLSNSAPLEPIDQPQDVAEIVALLAGPLGAWINDQMLGATVGII